MRPEIQKILAISTGHITEKDNDLLTEDVDRYVSEEILSPEEYMRACRKAGGFFVGVPGDHDTLATETPGLLSRGYSKEIIAILTLAREHGCDWIMLDCDAPVYEGLPQFSW